MEKLKIFVLTEGKANIGFGHITRMLSIYQAFIEKNIHPTFILNADNTVLDLVKDTNYKIYNWVENEEKLINDIKDADIVIIDSYLAPKSLYEKIAKNVKLAIYYDDNNRIEYPQGIVINGNIHATDLNYPTKKNIKYLLGTKYLPLRKEFWEVPEKNINKEVKSVMITFGGDDLRDMTPKILKVLKEKYPNLIKYVIIGKGFKNIKEIEEISDKNTKLIYYPNAKEMKEIMLKSDIAISAGGQTLYELARVGTPPVVIPVINNQLFGIKAWEKSKFVEFAGIWNEKNLIDNLMKKINLLIFWEIREKKYICGKSLIDGKGSIRIIHYILSHL